MAAGTENKNRVVKIGKPKLRVVGANAKAQPPEFGPEERQYFADLHRIIDNIFEEAAKKFEWTWSQLAGHASLGYQTVANLGDRITKFPRFQTVHKLARAVGWTLVAHEDRRNRNAARAKIKVAG